MKKGFTLIELLAVIVILAIIALIAVPVVLNIIDSSKVNAEKRSKELYIDAAQQAIARKNLTDEFNPISCIVQKDGNLDCNGILLIVETEGERPCSGKITFKNGKIGSETINFTDPVSFKEDSWKTVIANVQSGNTSVYESNVGDEEQVKEVILKGDINGKFKVRISNATTPAECSTPGFSQTACGFVIEFVDIITKYNMNPTATNMGGWPNSKLYQYSENEIYNSLPQEIKEAIIPTKVISGHGYYSDGNNFETTDNLYLLSIKEIYGSAVSSDTVNETRQLDYYLKNGVTTESGTYLKAKKTFDGKATTWWLRSAISSTDNAFNNVTDSGNRYTLNANATGGVAPAFRIG